MKKVHIIILLLLALIVFFLLFSFSTGNFFLFGRAQNRGNLSAANSYVFASPLLAKSPEERIRVTVFAFDGAGRGIGGKNVVVECKNVSACQEAGVIFYPVQSTTDSLGRGIFDISSQTPGQFEIQAKVEGVVIPQTVTVTFQ